MDEHRKEPFSEDQAGAGAASSGSGAVDGNDSGAVSAGAGEASAASSKEPAASNQVERLKTNAAASKDADRLGKVTIMAPSRHQDWYRNWDDEIEVEAPDEPAAAGRPHNKRQLALVAVAVILAAIAGAAGGALTNAGFVHLGSGHDAAEQAQSQARTLETQVAKLQSEVAALKDSVEQSTKTTSAQIGKATERLEKIEKAQTEPVQKIARLTETVEKLRTAQAEKPAPAPAATQVASAAQDVTGSVPAKPAAKQNDVGRLPTVEGWVLRDVYDGAAVVVGRPGTFEVYAGDPLPGLGRVDAIRRQDGRWVVVTSRGLIVAR